MHYIKRKAQTARSQKARKWLSVLLICLGIAPLCCGCAYLFDYYTGPDTSLKNYLKHGEDGWLHDEPYELFPSLEAVQSAEEQHYLYKKYTSPTFLLDDDILTYLSCTYTEEDYNTEIERLQNLCGGLDEQTFLVPAYVLFRNFPNGFSEYAIADADSHTVFYQFMVLWGLPIICTLFFIVCLLLERNIVPFKESEKRQMIPLAYPDLAVLLLALCAVGLILMPEVIFVKDIYSGEHYRANTMFKLTYQAFILFGMVMSYVIIRALILAEKHWIRTVSAVLCFILLMTGGFIVRSTKDWFGNVTDSSLRISTDASVFVDQSFSSDFAAISWLNNTVSGRPVVLEAPGDSYTGYERVSVATGLPTVRGWYVHEWLWRSDTDLLNERSADIETIYTGQDEQTVRDLIKKYKISYIYIGSLERSMYSNINDTLLQKIGTVAYSDGVSTYILKVAG